MLCPAPERARGHESDHLSQSQTVHRAARRLKGLRAVLISVLSCQFSVKAASQLLSFEQGAPYLRAPDGDWGLLPRERCGVTQIDAALDRLAQAAPIIKKTMLEAAIH